VELPSSTSASVRRIGLVESAGSIGAVIGTGVRRSPYIPSFETGGIGVLAAEPDVAAAAGAALRSGQFLTAATARYPVAVLGATAAAHLGIEDVGAGLQVWIAGRPFLVIGVLDPVGLAPELDRSVLVGWQEAMTDLSFDGHPTEAFVRSDPASVVTVRDVLAPTIDPEHPEEIAVSRPSDVLAARAAASDTLTGLLVGLGLVALLVGAIGIANVLLIGVIERRTEIGLRRALGATRRHVATQFLVEAIALGAIGGAVGCAAGVLVTVFYAFAHGWPAALPVELLLGAIGGSVAIASLAGTYPALRAGRLAPMTALRSA
jgi:putative ABC transport system permease protein